MGGSRESVASRSGGGQRGGRFESRFWDSLWVTLLNCRRDWRSWTEQLRKHGSVPLQANAGNGGKHNTAGEAGREVDDSGRTAADQLLQHQYHQLVCFSRKKRQWWRSSWPRRPARWSWPRPCADPDGGGGDGQDRAGEEPVAAQDVGELAQSSPRAVFNLRLSCELYVFSCPQQLNRWPCHSLSHSQYFYFWHYRVTLETCDLWDICSEWWGNMTWPTFFTIFWQF